MDLEDELMEHIDRALGPPMELEEAQRIYWAISERCSDAGNAINDDLNGD